MIRGAREQQMDSARKSNIGLNLKSNKRGEEVAGFTRKQENGWVYSKAGLFKVTYSRGGAARAGDDFKSFWEASQEGRKA